jgi:hypothetical protein
MREYDDEYNDNLNEFKDNDDINDESCNFEDDIDYRRF